MVVRASVFACVGTAGQRCTTTRRLILHDSVCIFFNYIHPRWVCHFAGAIQVKRVSKITHFLTGFINF